MDVLSEALNIVRLTGAIYFKAHLFAPWAVSSPPAKQLMKLKGVGNKSVSLFHILTEGQSHFKTESGGEYQLEKGDIIIFPHGSPHKMASNKHLDAISVTKIFTSENMDDLTEVEYGGTGAKTSFVCGYLTCDQRFNPLLGALPEVIVLKPEDKIENQGKFNIITIDKGEWLGSTVNKLIQEVNSGSEGGKTVITRLIELMYVEILRRYMHSLPNDKHGWIAGIRDPHVGLALKYMHSYPDRKWEISQLADQIHISRSALAKRFTQMVGQSPIQYLAEWRMQLAKNLLLRSDISMPMVAKKVGYESEFAFNRAFKRNEGCPPATWKKDQLRNV